jgi:hypothetical protein
VTQYYFIPPTVDEGPAGDNRLFWRYKITRADTVIKNADGSYSHYRAPGIDQLEAAEVFYQGGHIYPISEGERENLIKYGYSSQIVTVPQ